MKTIKYKAFGEKEKTLVDIKDVEKLINSLHITGGMTHFNLSEEHWISKEELKQKLKELGR